MTPWLEKSASSILKILFLSTGPHWNYSIKREKLIKNVIFTSGFVFLFYSHRLNFLNVFFNTLARRD